MLKTYVTDSVKVTFLMNACNPPMWIDCSDTIYDPKKHTRYDGKGNNISYFVWPCVYFSKKSFEAGKPVMKKGEVVTRDTDHVHQGPSTSSKEWQKKSSRKEPREMSQCSYTQGEYSYDDYEVIQGGLLENAMQNRQTDNRVALGSKMTRIEVKEVQVIRSKTNYTS